jgi:phosphoenolpyruvate synthase/pyruvate phosphate dikinase
METAQDSRLKSVVGERLSLAAFQQLSGTLAGYRFCKVVVDKETSKIHFINNNAYKFHADYIAEQILKIPAAEMEKEIDRYNQSFYSDLDRRFYLGIIAFHTREERQLFSLETVEVDKMNAEMLKFFFKFVQEYLDPTFPVLLKPANHHQEKMVSEMDPTVVPHIFSHELFATKEYVNLNPGKSSGRLRIFIDEHEYKQKRDSIEWYDIVVMNRVPDDIPRISGIINAEHTTPLSHTNVLAAGWQIPNCIQLGAFEKIRDKRLEGKWVEYTVSTEATELELHEIERPQEIDKRPSWTSVKITLEEPETVHTKIMNLNDLRQSDRFKFGTKAANLGELHYILSNGSDRLTAFYRIPRPPRAHLLPYLGKFLGQPETADLKTHSNRFLQNLIKIPRGIALPFSVQQQFLESSPKIQQGIGKLKMALELNERQVDSLCISLQQLIRSTRMPDHIRNYIDSEIANNLAGVSSFVIRSSSNAEDLGQFSAAGIYESINHVTTAENIFTSIKKVWASLVSPRSIRLRQDVGISLDDCYMGVVIQEEVKSEMGGVLVTTNPMSRADFRNVYLNVSTRSVNTIVDGTELPYQFLYNTVEGGGSTLSLGSATKDLSERQKNILQNLTFAGRLLQSHFSPDYTFSSPVDIEWIAGQDGVYILQLRPYCG